jgi:ribonuclease-3
VTKLAQFVRAALGHQPGDLHLFEQAVTHPSFGRDNYQRLEFLGDRVLGLIMAEWLEERFPKEPEGQLSHRFTTLVSRASCGEVGVEVGVPAQLRLGKQAREDGAARSENVVGDVVEALIGALYLDGGLPAARDFVRRAWAPLVESQGSAPRHPKSLLHEWAEGHGRSTPAYEVVDRSGPSHAPRFTVRVTVKRLGEALGTGSSKQEAETEAAAALLTQVDRASA